MAFIKGMETHSIDSKGRVSIPAKMRKALAPEAEDSFTLTRGVDKCVAVYPKNEWEKIEAKLSKLNSFNARNRYVINMINSWSEEAQLDAQQRIILPKRLAEFAGIDSKVTIVGMGHYIAFWNPEEYEQYMNKYDEPYETVAEQVMSSQIDEN